MACVEVAEAAQQVGPAVGERACGHVVRHRVGAGALLAAAARRAVVNVGEGVEPLAAADLAQGAHGAADGQRLACRLDHAPGGRGVVARDNAPEVVVVAVAVDRAGHAVQRDDVVAADLFGPVDEGHVAGCELPECGQRLVGRFGVGEECGTGVRLPQRGDNLAPGGVVRNAGACDDGVVGDRRTAAAERRGRQQKRDESFHEAEYSKKAGESRRISCFSLWRCGVTSSPRRPCASP